MSGHTKGPWAANDGIYPGFWIVSSKTRDITYVTLRDPEERAANARLIAAAPELLEAANKAFDFLGSVEGVAALRGELLAAIMKATQP